MNNRIKYRCLGAYVVSADFDTHYISASQVAKLYKVRPSECLFVEVRNEIESQRAYTEDFLLSLIDLWPDPTGVYKLPAKDIHSKN